MTTLHLTPSRAQGDMTNAIGKLNDVLAKEPFRSHVQPELVSPSVLSELAAGDPIPALRLLHYSALPTSSVVASFLLRVSTQPLLSATDQRFVDEL